MSVQEETVRRVAGVQEQLDNAVMPEQPDDLISPFLALPGLRGFWPMSAFQSNGDCFDQSGNGRLLTYNGNPTYNYDGLVPYIDLDGTGDFLSRPDEAGLDILGTEAYVAAAVRGLTLGGWFYFGNAAGAVEYLIAKDNVGANQRSYALRRQADGTILVLISPDGTGGSTVAANSVAAPSVSTWVFIVGYFDPSTELAVFVNEEKTTNATAVASIFNSGTALQIGANGIGASLLTGRASLCFLCAALLSDAIIYSLFQQTRAAFGV